MKNSNLILAVLFTFIVCGLCFRDNVAFASETVQSPSLYDDYVSDLRPVEKNHGPSDKFLLPGNPLVVDLSKTTKKISKAGESVSFTYTSETQPWPSWWYPNSRAEFFPNIHFPAPMKLKSFLNRPFLFMTDFLEPHCMSHR